MCVNALKVQGPSVWQGNAIKDLEKKIFFPENNKLIHKRQWKAHVKHSIHEPQRCVGGDYDQIGPQRVQMNLACIIHSVCPPSFEMLWEICRTPKSISQQ